MSSKMIPFFLLCETPLHVGVGQDVGMIDMPIQRERHTGWPKIESSGLKGSIRHSFERKYKGMEQGIKDINIAFGYDDNGLSEEIKKYFEGKKDFAGALGFTDARILLFPVKSMKGVFAWVTCPAVINRFLSDLKIATVSGPPLHFEENTISPGSSCIVKKGNIHSKAILEEYTIEVKEDEACQSFSKWLSEIILPEDAVYNDLKKKLSEDLIILDDDLFCDFTKLSTEVTTRTKIDNETGTVKGTALFTEEYLPAETIMYSLAIVSPIFSPIKGSFNGQNDVEKLEKFLTEGLEGVIQIGGNASLGKGLASVKMFNVSEVG